MGNSFKLKLFLFGVKPVKIELLFLLGETEWGNSGQHVVVNYLKTNLVAKVMGEK